MTPNPQSKLFPPRPLVLILRVLVLLPLLTLRDSAARPTFPQPRELENTAARLVRLPPISADSAPLLEADPRSADTFQPTPSLHLAKKTWTRPPPPAVASVTTTPSSATPSAPATSQPRPAFAPSHQPATSAHPAPPPSRPTRTLAAARGYPPQTPPADLTQLADQWNQSPQLRDRLLASFLRNPVIPTTTATATTTIRPANLDQPGNQAQPLNARLSFNPFHVVSHQLRAFATPADSAAGLRPPSGIPREYTLLGGRLPGGQAELRLGLLDLTEKQFRLNPGNFRSEESRERTAAVSARFRF